CRAAATTTTARRPAPARHRRRAIRPAGRQRCRAAGTTAIRWAFGLQRHGPWREKNGRRRSLSPRYSRLMLPRPLPIVLAALATSFATIACAQSPPVPPAQQVASAPAQAPRPGAPIKPQVDPRQARVAAAIQAAELGNFDAASYGDLADHPLYRWVEYASLRRN